jgi:hypothetical protein
LLKYHRLSLLKYHRLSLLKYHRLRLLKYHRLSLLKYHRLSLLKYHRLSLLKYHRLSLLKNHMLSFYVRFIYSNILAASTYGVHINLLIRYSGGCSSYHDFIDIGLLLTMKLLKQGFLVKSTTYLVNRYGISVSQNKNNHGYILFVVITIRSCSHS